MTDDNGRHDNRTLETGETVYLTKDPGDNWRIDHYDYNWFDGQHSGPGGVLFGPKELKGTKPILAQAMGWEDLRFDTEHEAYAFVAEQIRSGKVPGAKALKRS